MLSPVIPGGLGVLDRGLLGRVFATNGDLLRFEPIGVAPGDAGLGVGSLKEKATVVLLRNSHNSFF